MPQSPNHQPPNIIVILVDDMGYSDIGCYGSEIQTPNLNQLARNGIRCTQMYNGARCCPTRASLLTGLYAHQAGVGHMVQDRGTRAYQGYLRDDAVTIAEVLQASGYRTLMAGKWHVGGPYAPTQPELWEPGSTGHPTPLTRGFERFFGTLEGAVAFFTRIRLCAAVTPNRLNSSTVATARWLTPISTTPMPLATTPAR